MATLFSDISRVYIGLCDGWFRAISKWFRGKSKWFRDISKWIKISLIKLDMSLNHLYISPIYGI